MAHLSIAIAEPPNAPDCVFLSPSFATTEYTVGDKLIDDQHDHIFRLVNALECAGSAGVGARTADLLLVHLSAYLQSHFRCEERLMAERGYPKLRTHARQHAECSQRLADLLVLVNSNVMDPADCAPFVRDWLHNHLLGSDCHFAQWLQTRRYFRERTR